MNSLYIIMKKLKLTTILYNVDHAYAEIESLKIILSNINQNIYV